MKEKRFTLLHLLLAVILTAVILILGYFQNQPEKGDAEAYGLHLDLTYPNNGVDCRDDVFHFPLKSLDYNPEPEKNVDVMIESVDPSSLRERKEDLQKEDISLYGVIEKSSCQIVYAGENNKEITALILSADEKSAWKVTLKNLSLEDTVTILNSAGVVH